MDIGTALPFNYMHQKGLTKQWTGLEYLNQNNFYRYHIMCHIANNTTSNGKLYFHLPTFTIATIIYNVTVMTSTPVFALLCCI